MRDMLGNEAINLPAEGEVEIWKPVEGWPRYEVSSFGRVRNVLKGNILMPLVDKNGYHKVFLYDKRDGKTVRKDWRIGRLVCLAFYGEPEGEKQYTDHIDRCRVNDYYKNLRWASGSENMKNRNFSKSRNFNYGDKKTPILLLDKETGEILERFTCARQAERKCGINYIQIITQLNGGRKAFKIGKFVREEDYLQGKT